MGIFPEESSHAGPGENGLGDQRAAKQEGNIKTNNGDKRQNCIAQYMLEKYVAAAQPLGARRAHVIHAQYFQNAGTQITGITRSGDRHQAENRQDEMPRELQRIFWIPDIRAGGKVG